MDLKSLLPLYTAHSGVQALARTAAVGAPLCMAVEGLRGSAAPMAVAAMMAAMPEAARRPMLIVMSDDEEAGYFYHDMAALLDEGQVLFYPST